LRFCGFPAESPEIQKNYIYIKGLGKRWKNQFGPGSENFLRAKRSASETTAIGMLKINSFKK